MMDPSGKLFKLGRTFVSVVAGSAVGWGASQFYSIDKTGSNRSEGYQFANSDNSNQLIPKQWISQEQGHKYDVALKRCRELVKRFQHESGAPGVVVGVSVDGTVIWKEGK